MQRVLVLVLVAVVACSGRGPQAIGSQPSWRGHGSGSASIASGPGPVTFAPSGRAAARYNEPVQAPPSSPLGDAVVLAVKDAAARAGTATPVADARLFRACAELAEVVPEEGIIQYSVVEFALQRHGIIEPSPNLLVVWGNIDSPELIVDQLRPRLAEILAEGATARVGIGSAKRLPDGTGAVVFALQGSGVTTQPIPRAIDQGGSFALDAVVDAQYRDPEVYVTRNNGATERLDLTHGHAGRFTTRVACKNSHGKQQVEITANGAQGSTVLANFPVWCASEPPVSFTVEPSVDDAPTTDPAEAERRLLALVNRDRQAAGLPALIWDDKVADVSRMYSEEMRKTKVVAHLSPLSGSAADRVRAAKIKTAVVLEN
ncbi:MAG: CAP domain-containing protein, partial [Kofleriaceae bacterium]